MIRHCIDMINLHLDLSIQLKDMEIVVSALDLFLRYS